MPRWFIPEVVQTSALDCGPAALSALLGGFGIPASYGRLREACQTDVDGTSIDALEETANALGLEAVQTMAPADHLLCPEAGFLPAVVVVKRPGGVTHFVVVWRRAGGFVQVMDPAVGRQWISWRRFQGTVFLHTQSIPADCWLSWARSDEFRKTICARMRRLGLPGGRFAGRTMTEAALAEGWRPAAALDAAVRMAESLVESGAVRRGAKLESLVTGLASDPDAVPEVYRSVTPDPEDPDRVRFRAAVFLHARGRSGQVSPDLPPELRAALQEPPARPWRALCQFVARDSRLAPVVAAGAVALATAGVVFEAILFRGLFDLGRDLRLAGQRWWAGAALAVLLSAMLLLGCGAASLLANIGRKLEVRLRFAFLRKVPLLGDRYFQSRLISDMAERSHSLHRSREMPALATGLLQPVCELLLTVAGIIWLSPAGTPLAVLAALAAIGIPLLAQPGLAAADLRVRTHAGALSLFHLDALLGSTAVRAHGAATNLLREQNSLLREWANDGLEFQRTVALVEGVQLAVTLALAGLLIFRGAVAQGDAGGLLLLVYWALRLPSLGQEAAAVCWQYPGQRNTALRLLEPLGAPEEHMGEHMDEQRAEQAAAGIVSVSPQQAGMELHLDNVTVCASGHFILRDVTLCIASGEHVGIVGPSGAGKSSLLGLFLGWHRAAAGSVLADGQPLDCETVRRESAWVDPQVQLWNRSLLDNLRYGAGDGDVETAMESANLRGVVSRLPQGLESALGEGGALVSGGEGQRVRLGRGMMKSGVRLVMLDEPARGLDRSARRFMLDRAREIWRNQTLLAVTHDVSDTLDLPRVLVVEDGAIVEDGDPRRLAGDPNSRYRALLDAEDSVRRGLWASGQWRRLRLADGKVHEEPRQERTCLTR